MSGAETAESTFVSQQQLNALGELGVRQLVGGNVESFANCVEFGASAGVPIFDNVAYHEYRLTTESCWAVIPGAAATLELPPDCETLHLAHVPAQYVTETEGTITDGYYGLGTPRIEISIDKHDTARAACEWIVLSTIAAPDDATERQWQAETTRQVWNDFWRDGQIMETHPEQGPDGLTIATWKALRAVFENIALLENIADEATEQLIPRLTGPRTLKSGRMTIRID